MRRWHRTPAVVVPAAVLSALLVTGCVTVKKSVLDRSWSSEPVATEDVYVFLRSERDVLPESCTRVALLYATAGGSVRGPRMIEKLREEAGQLGANAVYVQTMNEPGTVERVAGAVFDVPVDSDSDALALRCDEADLPRSVRQGPVAEARPDSLPADTP